MSKPIKLTEELRQQAIEEFAQTLSKVKMADGKICYNKNFTYKDDDKATVLFTSLAYTKMIRLMMAFDSEVAWHGCGERIDNTTFLITDILVYPQTVTGATVDMDPEEYVKWLMENEGDERFYNIIMQGHSHVMMPTTPSTTDLTHQEDILNQLKGDGFYIFMIWNKKLENNMKIYDLANNVLYENKDIVYGIYEEEGVDEFLDEARAVVTKHIPQSKPTYYGGSYSGQNNGVVKSQCGSSAYKSQEKRQEKKEEKGSEVGTSSKFGNGWGGRGLDEMDEFSQYGCGYYGGYFGD